MLRHLPFILKSTLRNKRRTLLTVISIALSLSLLGFLLAVYNMFYFEGSSQSQAFRMVVRNKVSVTNPLPRSYQARIAQVPGVQDIMIFQWFGGVYKDARDPNNFFGRFAVEAAKVGVIYPEYRVPEDQRKAFVTERSAAMCGRKLAQRFGWKVGERVTFVGDIFPVTLNTTLRAIYDSDRDNENYLFHYDYLNESLPAGRRDFIGTFALRMTAPEDANRITQAVDNMFRNAPLRTKTETERAFELSFLSFFGNVKAFLFTIFAAISFTVLLVSGNTMAMSVRERIKEVGVLKTLGFTNGKVLTILLGEAMVIALLGGSLAALAVNALCATLRNGPSTFADMSRLVTPPWVLASCFIISAVIGLVSSFVPAWNAARRPILEALRVTD